MKHTKLMLAIAMLLVGMVIPINLRDGLSDLLFGATFMWIIVNQEFFFGDGTKKLPLTGMSSSKQKYYSWIVYHRKRE